MTDRPIIFSSAMISVLLEGRKTMTRRLTTSPLANSVPGDRLWVRESCADEHPLAVQEGRYSQAGRAGIPGPPSVSFRTIYRADGEPLQIWRNESGEYPYFSLERPKDESFLKHPTISSNYTRDGKGIYWTSSIHAPRWASRLTLIVTSSKIERLHDISAADSIAEGVQCATCEAMNKSACLRLGCFASKGAFAELWCRIHGREAWDANPEVVAIRFRVVKANIDAVKEMGI